MIPVQLKWHSIELNVARFAVDQSYQHYKLKEKINIQLAESIMFAESEG